MDTLQLCSTIHSKLLQDKIIFTPDLPKMFPDKLFGKVSKCMLLGTAYCMVKVQS